MARADISKANKAEVLMRLWNYGLNLGKGFMREVPLAALLQAHQKPMELEEAEKLVQGQDYFDYVKGRSMKVDLKGPIVEFWLYDRDTGEGNARRALEGVAGVEFIED